MTATLLITCVYGAPEGWQWAADINKHFHHPIAWLDGAERALSWDQPTRIEVAVDKPHKLQVFLRVAGLHFCSAEVDLLSAKSGDASSYTYRLEASDRFMNRGHLAISDS